MRQNRTFVQENPVATMKSNAPWSVKGIARDTRETAKEAARKEGMTVGEWLNHMIHQAGHGEFTSQGDVSGMQLRDLATAIEHLNIKLGRQDEKSVENLNTINHSLTGIIERIQKVERIGGNEAGATLPIDLEDRLTKLEQKTNDTNRINALRALEKAVGQVAAQFDQSQRASNARLETTEQSLHTLTDRLDQIDAGITNLASQGSHNIDVASPIGQSLSDITNRLTTLETNPGDDDALTDPHFAERTGKRLRVLGDEIKRSGDQVRSLEALIGKLADQIDAAEQRSSDGLQKVTETMNALQAKLSAGQSPADGKIDTNLIKSEVAAAVAEATRKAEEKFNARQEAYLSTRDNEHSSHSGKTSTEIDANDTETMHGAIDNELPGEPSQALTEPDEDWIQPASTNHPSGTPTGSLYDEDDEEEISVEGDFDSAFNDIDFDADATDDLDDDDLQAPVENNDLDLDLDAEQNEAKLIAAEINDLLGGEPLTSNETTATHATSEPENSIEEDDPFAAPNETIAPPRHATSPSEADGDSDLDFGEFNSTSPAKAKAQAEGTTHDSEVTKKEATSSAGKLPRTPEGRIDIARLTPTQKAVLAARARKKREAQNAQQGQPETKSRHSARKSAAAYQPYDDRNRNDIDRPSITQRMRGLLPAGRKVGTDEGTQSAVPLKKKGKVSTGKTSAKDIRNRQRNTVEETGNALFIRDSRPTLPLMLIGAFLTICLIMFLIRPLFTSKSPPALENTNKTTPPTTVTAPASNTEGIGPLLTTPSAQNETVRPRQLFLESMAILEGSIETTAESGSATNDVTDAAFQDLLKAASLGYPPAQFQLGEFYKDGIWTPRDAARARTWFHRSAEGGNVYAMHRLGYLYAEGEGGSADILTAVEKFELAANLGFVDSQYNLGAIFDPGPGNTPQGIQDIEKAYYWYALAALNGDNQAGNKASELGARLSSEQKAVTDEKIADWRALPVNVSANENLSDG